MNTDQQNRLTAIVLELEKLKEEAKKELNQQLSDHGNARTLAVIAATDFARLNAALAVIKDI